MSARPIESERRSPVVDDEHDISIDTHNVIAEYAQWLPTTTSLPKLWIDVSKGVLVNDTRREFARSLPNQRTVPVEGRHFVQEDDPDAIGEALSEWITSLR
jgi:haloalkane dehalogenase